jgi:hypothetical protein
MLQLKRCSAARFAEAPAKATLNVQDLRDFPSEVPS